MPVTDFPIVGFYDKQRFAQFNPSDCANFYMIEIPQGKKKFALYPTMGRRHITASGQNKLIFPVEPRGMFRSVNYGYIVSGPQIYRIDSNFNQVEISQGKVTTLKGDIFFSYLVTPSVTFACFVDGQHIYVFNENTLDFDIITDTNAPTKPTYIATFGFRLVVSQGNSSEFRLSVFNLLNTSGVFDPATAFTYSGSVPVMFAQEDGIIRQLAVLHNTLYIFTDFNTGIWSFNSSVLTSQAGTATTFPFRKNTTNAFDFGIFDPKTLDVSFSRMTWIAQNKDGLIQVMTSSGEAPKRISTRAIDILFQKNSRLGIIDGNSPFLNGKADGFHYQWENTIFYRLSAGDWTDNGILDIETTANSIEYNFETQTWHRVIEKNGERNRIQKHIYFSNTHLVSLNLDNTVYEMSGQFYDNEITNPDAVSPQAPDAYIAEPFLYERVTPIIAQDDYGEFITDWVQIDFVWGELTAIYAQNFANAEFIIDEAVGSDGQPQFLIDESSTSGQETFLITEDSNTPQLNSATYNALFKPHIELYWSDDGGVSYFPADVLQFSQLGVYSWRMRWYQLGPSRNRTYKLICVSPSPIVILGGIMMTRDVADGSY